MQTSSSSASERNPESRASLGKKNEKGRREGELVRRIAYREAQRSRRRGRRSVVAAAVSVGSGRGRSRVRTTGLGRESALGHARGPRFRAGVRRCRRKPLAAHRRRRTAAAAVQGAMTQRCLRSPSVNFADCESPLPGDTFEQAGRRCYAPGRVSTPTRALAPRRCGVVPSSSE
ncbi:hypothetical protein IscW_ISCW005317 [Ixodes scapularis]|uniref:Uncharacterized protein n=1 Tax=Ixodes scapularis TaxID=6945 RepID=B7PNR3_IXOSC|nr:hypothetical protein IscW_ISCW005317 [Ixodes scapularis]|eukprot:XP_002435405.1 hypothetical protein IscW_ISCW005317 [Ixodes scapularis]